MAETPSLMDDVVEEILLRLPPDDPESLLRAALVCKSWCRLVSSPAFNRRFRDRTSSPPVLGFFYRVSKPLDYSFIPANTHFMPLTSFRRLPHAFLPTWGAVDARGGRVLFYDVNDMATPEWVEHLHLTVWNPMTGEASKLPVVPMDGTMRTWSAALICGDDNASSLGAFRVAVVAYIQRPNSHWFNSGCVYSSEQQAWSTPVYKQFLGAPQLMVRHALIGKSLLYFPSKYGIRCIVAYDISKQELSFIQLPMYTRSHGQQIALMPSMDGRLGVAVYTFTREVGPNGDVRWNQERELGNLISFSDFNNYYKTRVPAVDDRVIVDIVPYASFCTPAVPRRFLDD